MTRLVAVAVVQVEFVSHATDGLDAIVVAVVGRLFVPDVNVVEVAVRFQPFPDPVASPTSIAWLAVIVWFNPVSAVDGNVTFGTALTNPSEPAVKAAVAVVASAAAGTAHSAAVATAARTSPLATVAATFPVFLLSIIISFASSAGALPSFRGTCTKLS